jgi:hypothetical protein
MAEVVGEAIERASHARTRAGGHRPKDETE